MATTIQVEKETLELLKMLKESRKAKSYDETVRNMLAEAWPKKSMWGILGKKPMKEILKDLRDEGDRI